MSGRFDVAIIGGGPAGATLAALLARRGRAVAVVERAAFPRRKVCGEFLSATNLPILERLGLAGEFCAAAGPDIRRVGLFAGESALAAPMPPARRAANPWGRALGREHFDSMLLRRAAEAGATVLQPWTVSGFARDGTAWRCALRGPQGAGARWLTAGTLIAAHGSWEPGTLPSQPQRRAARAGDLFAFKAHFRSAALAPDLMPLVVFPGGYGGLVATDGGRTSLSWCIRRDRLAVLRRAAPDLRAGEAALAHICAATRGVREVLAPARREGAILAAGPIRPGIRIAAGDSVLRIGNAAGEAHPIIAEGIGMAMQSAALLFECLTAPGGTRRADDAARAYARRWRTAFAPRIVASAAFAEMAVHAPLRAAMREAVSLWPRLLTAGAYLAGKTKAA